MKLAYITSNPLTETSGGVSAVSYHTYKQLSCHFEVRFKGHIQLKYDFIPQYTSKIRRKFLRLPGNFDFFSPKRLGANANAVIRMIDPDVDVAFFKGCTPWLSYRSLVPYFAYVDICFHTFFFNTFSIQDFRQSDLDRIWRQEAEWMKNAAGIFFESEWGLRKARDAYLLEGKNFICVGRGGNIPVPENDIYVNSNLRLVSIARNYRQKGGDIIFSAYLELKKMYPKLVWDIVGGEPDIPWRRVEGVRYHGLLDKKNTEELKQFKSLLEQAFLLVHPSREDATPLVISEAGYFGCPTISVKNFAIPELVKNGDNGILLDYPVQAEALVNAVKSLIENPARYIKMRRKAREIALRTASWDTVGDRMAQHIVATLK